MADETLADTVEKLRAERFSHLDKELVREILRLHGDVAQSSSPTLQVMTAIKQYVQKKGN